MAAGGCQGPAIHSCHHTVASFLCRQSTGSIASSSEIADRSSARCRIPDSRLWCRGDVASRTLPDLTWAGMSLRTRFRFGFADRRLGLQNRLTHQLCPMTQRWIRVRHKACLAKSACSGSGCFRAPSTVSAAERTRGFPSPNRARRSSCASASGKLSELRKLDSLLDRSVVGLRAIHRGTLRRKSAAADHAPAETLPLFQRS